MSIYDNNKDGMASKINLEAIHDIVDFIDVKNLMSYSLSSSSAKKLAQLIISATNSYSG